MLPRLRPAQLVAAEQHGHALGEEERGQEVASLARAEDEHLGVVGGAFHAAVPGPVVGLAVPSALPVGVVVLALVAHQVGQGEAVVCGHEVDAGGRSAAVVLVEVGAAGEAAAEIGHHVRLAPPDVAHGVPEASVPLRPMGRELAHLVAALPDVPWLGDELHRPDDGVLLDDVEEGRETVDGVELPRQGGRQVEAEAVHVHLLDPVAQAVHDELQDVRLEHVERVARARVVHVAARVVGQQPVVGLVVQAAQRQRGAGRSALGGVVVDDVEDDLEARRVERFDHGLELVDLLPARPGRRVLGVGREVADGVVTPVVA